MSKDLRTSGQLFSAPPRCIPRVTQCQSNMPPPYSATPPQELPLVAAPVTQLRCAYRLRPFLPRSAPTAAPVRDFRALAAPLPMVTAVLAFQGRCRVPPGKGKIGALPRLCVRQVHLRAAGVSGTILEGCSGSDPDHSLVPVSLCISLVVEGPFPRGPWTVACEHER
jgi:hypothetical protein